MKKHVLGLLVFFLSGMAYVNASHIMGGYFNWEYINKDTIKVYATFMADCNSSEEFRTNENFNCWSGNICKYYKLTKLSTTDITPLCSNQCSACSGGSCSIKYGIKEMIGGKPIYVTIVSRKSQK